MINTIAKILGIHRNSYFNWRKQERPIMSILEKYFSKEDLLEYLKTGKISKLERIKELEDIEQSYIIMIKTMKKLEKEDNGKS